MSNLKLLKILNPVMFIVFLIAAKAVMLYKYSPFFNLKGNEAVYEIHETAGKIFILLAIFHIILNWKWIKLNVFGIKPKTTNKKKK